MKASMQKSGLIIVWIRRELRVADHAALHSAAGAADQVLPLYIFEDHMRVSQKQAVLLQSLGDLRARLEQKGGTLFLRQGDPEQIIPRLIGETGAAGVYLTASVVPSVARRDSRIESVVKGMGKQWIEFRDNVAFGGSDILTKQSTPYTVFTPYRNAWMARLQEIPPPVPALRRIASPGILPGSLPAVPEGFSSIGGESNGAASLRRFVSSGLKAYGKDRDIPGKDGTSRLSHHLALGTIGVRTLVHSVVEASPGLSPYLNEIIWREFYYQVMKNFPRVETASFKKEFDGLRWSQESDLFKAWSSGQTGIPMVDAAMRQLNTTGWMHNRGRMIVASFLTKDLHIDWRLGEEYFMKMLIDGDPALNNGGWQWSAGTGTDAQPWFRIFHPVTQGKKFDPAGVYVRRYVPELRLVPDRFIHEPWLLPASDRIKYQAREYPSPVVDHGKERLRTIALYSALKRKLEVSVL